MESLKNISLKTLLIYPPEKIENGKYFANGVPYGIALLRGFLESNGYHGVRTVDFYGSQPLFNRFKEKVFVFIERYSWSSWVRYIYKSFFSVKESPEGRKTNCLLNLMLSSDVFDSVDKKSRLFSDIKRIIEAQSPRLVGISVQYYCQLYYAFLIAKIIKSVDENIFVVLGGAIVTRDIEYLISSKKVYKIVDGFIVKQGEEPLASLIKCLSSSGDFKSVPNFYYRVKGGYQKSDCLFESGQEYLNIVPLYDDFKHCRMPVRISLGCYWGRCTFCEHRLSRQEYTVLSVEKAVDLIKRIRNRYGVSEFNFVDDSIPPVFLKKFSEKLLEENVKIHWRCVSCLDTKFLQDDIPSLMRKAGCVRIFFGLESISDRVLSLMDKMQRSDIVSKIIKKFDQAGITVLFTLIFGFPGETKEEALETIKFISKYKKVYTAFYTFSLCKGSIVYHNPTKFGVKNIKKRDGVFGLQGGLLYDKESGMTSEELDSVVKSASEMLKRQL